MSIRNYADTAIEQGKLATEQANQFFGTLAGRAAGAVGELRAQAEHALPLDTIKSAVEPYVEQARKLAQKQAQNVSHRAEGLLGTVRQTVTSDPRLAKAVATAETVAGALVETVQDRVVTPVVNLAGRGDKPASRPASKPAASAARKPAATRPATKSATKPATKAATKSATKSATNPATKPAAKKATAKPVAKKSTTTAPNKRTTKSTAAKSTG
jgi:hypothetical protein